MSCSFPDTWKIAKVTPIGKIENASKITDFRPISLLPALSKVLERLLCNQMISYLNINNLFSEYQSGYRQHHSTVSALVKIVDDIKLKLDRREFVVLALLDFSKAFDSINHKILFWKLKNNFNFDPLAIKLIESYLSDRKQFVVVSEKKSELLGLSCGVPQGSILGPILFSLYINDLPQVFLNSKCHLYADDCQIYSSSKFAHQNELLTALNKDIDRVVKWSANNCLDLNAQKTQSIIFCNKNSMTNKFKSAFPEIIVNGSSIKYSNTVKNLGIILDEYLTFESHINSICNKVHYSLSCLINMKKFTDIDLRIKLVKSLIVPHLTFGDILFSGTHVSSMKKLQTCYNSAIRFIFGLKKYDHISMYRSVIFGMNLEDHYKHRSLSFLYNCLSGNCPTYFKNYFKFSFSYRRCDLEVKKINLEIGKSAFLFRGAILWNSIPNYIKTIPFLQKNKKKFLNECSKFFINKI